MTAHLALDNRTGTRTAEATEEIRLSPAWETDEAGATATVSLDGVAVASSSTDDAFAWTPSRDGTYTFTHAVRVGGSPVGETLTATFVVEGVAPSSYTVTLDANGGSCPLLSMEVDPGATYGYLPAATREGHSFLGWYTSAYGGARVYESDAVYASATLYAQWEVLPVTLHFDANGGEYAPPSETRDWGSNYGELPETWRTGYDFLGWYTSAWGGSEVGYWDSVYSDAWLYAQWEAITCTLWFDANGGDCAVYSRDFLYGASYGDLPVPEREGYTFLGWYTSEEGGDLVGPDWIVLSDADLYAHWRANTYAVSFDANGGTVDDALLFVEYDGAFGELPVPALEGHTFLGWYDDEGCEYGEWSWVPPHDLELHAEWELDSYDLVFDAAGGYCPTSRRTVDYGAAYGTLPTATRTGHTFLGWFTDEAGGSQARATDVMGAGGAWLYARWEAISYTIAFDANGGEAIEARVLPYGTSISELPVPRRPGYEFLGWYTSAASGSRLGSSATVTGAATYYAHWRLTLGGALCGGDREVETGGSGTVAIDGSITHNGEPAVRVGGVPNSGTGWMETPVEGAATVSFWWNVSSENGYDVFKVLLDGEERGVISGKDGTWRKVTLTVPAGAHALRWAYSKDDANLFGSDCGWVSGLSVVRTDVSCTVSFDAHGGSPAPSSRTVSAGGLVGTLPTPSRAGFYFAGWYTSASGGVRVASDTVVSSSVTYHAQWCSVAVEDPVGPVGPGPIVPPGPGPIDLYDPPAWEDLGDDGDINWEDYYDGDEEAFAAEAAAVFNGYLLDGDEVAGSIQVKAAKKNKRTGVSKVTATVNALGSAKRLSFKGTMGAGGVATLSCAGQPALSLVLGTNAMWGELGAYEIAGARDVFKKSGDPKASALSRWLGVYTLVLETADASGANADLAWGYSGLSVEVKAKGRVKVTGTLVDGTKVSTTGQLLVGEGKCCVPVVAPLYSKQGGFGLNLWLFDDGTTEASNLSAWDAAASKTPFTAWWSDDVPLARVGSAPPSGLTFVFDGEYDLGSVELLYDFLPWEVPLGGGAKWTLPRAGSVKWDAEEEGYVDAKASDNPSGLKLTYVAKTGAFKGSFKVYGDQGGRLKKYTANVSGVMVGTTGYGTAIIKNVGSCPVRILP